MNVSSVKNLNGEVFSAVQDASLTNVVQSNSAQWAEGGGGSVSSKYGTISVDGSDIEATNKAIEFKSNGFTSSFESKMVQNYEPLVLTWDDYSEGTIIHVNAFNMADETGTLTYSSNTNVTGEIITGAYGSYLFDVQIPNATAIQFTTDKTFQLQNGTRVTAPSSFKVSELAWKTDLPTYTYNSDHKVSAINGSALVGNEDYLAEQGFVQNLTSPKGTISVLNNNNIEGTNSAISSDVIEGFVSAYYRVDVYPGKSYTLTWERYVPNTRLFVSGAEYYQDHTLNYSADTSVTGVITVPTGGQVSIELPTDSKSIVIGNEKWDVNSYNFTVSAADYYEIGELAWKSDIPSFEHDSSLSGDGTSASPFGVVPGYNETVLWSGNGTTAFTASEPLTNFERIKFYLNSDVNAEISCVEVPMIGRNTSAIKLSWCDTWKNDGQWKFLNWNGVLNNTGMSAFNNNTTTYLGLSKNFNASGGSYGAACPLFYKVIGVNRKAQ